MKRLISSLRSKPPKTTRMEAYQTKVNLIPFVYKDKSKWYKKSRVDATLKKEKKIVSD